MNNVSRLSMKLFLILSILFTVFPVFGHDKYWHDGHDAWAFTGEYDDIVYLVSHDELRIERYDMKQSAWLAPLIPPAQPTAFTVDQLGVVIATGRDLYTAATGTTEFIFLSESVGSVHSLTSDGSATLYITMEGTPGFASRNRNTGVLIDNRDLEDGMTSAVYSSLHHVLLARDRGDMLAVDLFEPDDSLASRRNPDHPFFPDADQLWLFPSNNRVLDSAGMIYSVPDLNWVGSVAGKVHGSVFNTDATYVLSDGVVRKFDDKHLEIGRYAVHENTDALYGSNQTLFSFAMIDGIPSVDSFPTTSVVMPTPLAVDPASLTFTADEAFTALDGSILVLSEDNNALLSYSPLLNEFTHGHALQGTPEVVVPAIHSNSLFIAYDNASITRLDLNTGIENTFLNLPRKVTTLVPFEDRLLIIDSVKSEGYWTVDLNGLNLQSPVNKRSTDGNQIWMDTTREMLRAEDSHLTAQAIAEDYTFGALRESSTFIIFANIDPLILSPDQSQVLTGSGYLFDTSTLDSSDQLPEQLTDGIWVSDGYIVSLNDYDDFNPFIIGDTAPPNEIDFTVWGTDYAQIRSVTFQALNAKLVQTGSRIFLIVDEVDQNQPKFIEIFEGSDDLDGDGVVDSMDAFPIDPHRSAPSDIETDGLITSAVPDCTIEPGFDEGQINFAGGINIVGSVEIGADESTEEIETETDGNSPPQEIVDVIETDGCIASPELIAEIEPDESTPLTEVTAEIEPDESTPLTEVTAEIESNESTPLTEVTAEIESNESTTMTEVDAEIDTDESGPLLGAAAAPTQASVGSIGFLTSLLLGLAIVRKRFLEVEVPSKVATQKK